MYGINKLVTFTDAAFVAEVLEVGAPRWNSKDGCPWPGRFDPASPGSEVEPQQFREVKVKATRVVFDSGELAVKPGDVVTLRFLGDGTAAAEPAAPSPSAYDLYGPVRAGETIHVLAYVWDMRMEDRVEYVPSPFDWQGYWRVQDGMAVNIVPARTVPLEPLIARILEERRVGEDPRRDPNTEYNPLGDPNAPPEPGR